MCGILCIVRGLQWPASGAGPDGVSPAVEDFIQPGLRRRGPDAQASCSVQCGCAHLHFHGSLLQLRGAGISSNPLLDAASGNVLLFNGQVFGGQLEVPALANDAQLLLHALCQPSVNVAAQLTGLRGPWALVFWQQATQTLWFGRDAIGRRSLLLHLPCPEDGRLMLCSVAPLDPAVPFLGFSELPPGLHSVQLPLSALAPANGNPAAASGGRLAAQHSQHEWTDRSLRQLVEYRRQPELVQPPEGLPPVAAAAACPAGSGERGDSQHAFECTVDSIMAALQHAVAVRCRCIEQRCVGDEQQQQGVLAGELRQLDLCDSCAAPLLLPPAPVLILFSGGVDSTLLAVMAHRALPAAAPIDLACICFDGGASPDRLAALDALQELRAVAPSRTWRLICVDASLAEVEAQRGRLLRLLAPADTVMDYNIGAALWLAARAEGTLLPEGGAAGRDGGGGAAAADADAAPQRGQQQDAPPQTAGEEVQVAPHSSSKVHTYALCDGGRESTSLPSCPAISGLAEKQQAGTGHRQQEGAAGLGSCGLGSRQRCRSAARVVLLGHGADELCGGYGRHRTAFRERGWRGLEEELGLDLRRLWLRNLGRDDRLVADHAREARHPFLDEALVAAVLAAPLHHVADLRLPPGQGDKCVLRACLHRLGLPRAAGRVKRAIQFGSRLAAKVNAAQFGGTRRANAVNAGSVRLADVPQAC